LGSLVEVVSVGILFKIHFIQMMESLCRGATVMVYVEHLQCTEWTCSMVFVGDR